MVYTLVLVMYGALVFYCGRHFHLEQILKKWQTETRYCTIQLYTPLTDLIRPHL